VDVAAQRTIVPCLYLVVANQTANSSGLRHAILGHATSPGASFHLLVPASRARDQDSSLAGSEHLRTWPGEDLGFALARYRLGQAMRRWADDGVSVTGAVGSPDPLQAIIECLAAVDVDEILVSTLPRRSSRWLEAGLLRRLRRVTALPVSHLEATLVP
jgi:hypothetical protein